MKTTYRGRPVEYAVHNRKAGTYALFGADDACIAELKEREFLAIRNRTNLEVHSGRYRPAGSKDQRGADRKSGPSGGDDTLDAFLYAASPLWTAPRAGKGSGAGLTARELLRAQQLNSQLLAQLSVNQLFSPAQLQMIEMQKQPPLKREGIVAGEIVGYRCWRIVRGDPAALIGRLRSVYQSDIWNPGDILQGRELGDWDSRGIHAWKDSGSREYNAYIRGYLNREADPFASAFYFGDNNSSADRPAMVTGTVFLWGDVVEHERGYRAEFARVRSLDWLYPDEIMMGREAKALDDLRRLYGVMNS